MTTRCIMESVHLVYLSAFFFTCSVHQMGFFVKQNQLAIGVYSILKQDFCKFDNYTLCLCKQYIISFKIYRDKTRNDYDFASLPHLDNFIVYLQIALETEQE